MLGALLYLPNGASASLAPRVIGGRSLTARAVVAAVRAGARIVGVPSALKDPALERSLARAPALARAVRWLDTHGGAQREPFASIPCLLVPASSLVDEHALVPLASTASGPRSAVLARSLQSGAPVLLAPGDVIAWLWDRLAAGEAVAAELVRYALEHGAEQRDGPGLFMAIHDAAGLARAERALHLALRSESDSRLDGILHRPYSRWLTRLLATTPATPNQVTLASLIVGCLAIRCFWHATPSTVLWGILLYWFANIVDHCDGELARLTFQESPFGAHFDWVVDTVVHSGLVLAISMTGSSRISVATLAAAGVALSAWFAPRAQKIDVGVLGRALSNLGNRDPFYVVLVAFALFVWILPTLVGALALLVAVGSHAYWIGGAAQLHGLSRGPSSTGPLGCDSACSGESHPSPAAIRQRTNFPDGAH